MARWKVFYEDMAFTSDELSPRELPNVGVQAVADCVDGLCFLWIYGEVYAWLGDRWEASHAIEPHWPEPEIVLEGELIDTEKFKAIRAEAMGWLDGINQ